MQARYQASADYFRVVAGHSLQAQRLPRALVNNVTIAPCFWLLLVDCTCDVFRQRLLVGV
jgi:hypothetical protein